MNLIKDNNSPYIKFFFTKNEQLPEFMAQHDTGALIVVEKQDDKKNYYELYRDNKLISSGYGFHDSSLIKKLTKIANKYDADQEAADKNIKAIDSYLKQSWKNMFNEGLN